MYNSRWSSTHTHSIVNLTGSSVFKVPFLRWTIVPFLICLHVYLLSIDSNLQTLNTPVKPTYTVLNKISQSFTINIPHPTVHSPHSNKKYLVHMPSRLFLLFLGYGCSGKILFLILFFISICHIFVSIVLVLVFSLS